jgi:AcrR family transcriptional regulator
VPAAATIETDDSTRRRIIDAAMECFIQLGMAKTSLSDVARVAGVSRGTVYRYFDDRQTLVDAVVAAGAQEYFDDAARAMKAKRSLATQVGAFASVAATTAASHRSPLRIMTGDTALMRIIAMGSEESLARTTEFLRPYVEAAQEKGEVGAHVDTTEASEWLARVIMSITSVPSSLSFDIEDPPSVARYVERFAVAGLGPR